MEARAAGSPTPRLRRRLYSGWWSPDAVIAALVSWHRRCGAAPTREDFATADRSAYPNPSTVVQVFGGWNRALEAAGLPLNKPHPPLRRWSDQEILEEIRRSFAAGDTTSAPFCDGRRRPWLAVIRTRFGSWNRACQLAGVIGDLEQQRRELQAAVVEAYRAGVPKPEIQRRFGVSRGYVREARPPRRSPTPLTVAGCRPVAGLDRDQRAKRSDSTNL